jgi:predicted metal-dependent RNase
LAWLREVKRYSPRLRRVLLVHGEGEAQEVLAGLIRAEGLEVGIPALGDRVRV